ncbi:ECF transporter S component [Aciduricibacillus chroicocephali]|uniref:Riboflavin transporter n=1 Tax=Aciduricibacillus chroicocephali TaxID=3054939 RepID=A0ABY9L2M8_9BACI|nr:ECF transporter S component [Bacillaceae bacterium 44XB]
MVNRTQSTSKLVKLIILALLGTVSLLLFFLNFPLPMLPPFLKIDFSDVPAVLAAFMFSPLAGVIVVGIKNLLYFAVSGASDPIGVAANFLAGVMFTVPVAIVYHKYKKGVKTIVSGLVVGTVVMAIGMTVLNYFVMLPLYSIFMGWGNMGTSEKMAFALKGVLPFNILKGIVVGILFVPLYVKMRSWIDKKRSGFAS